MAINLVSHKQSNGLDKRNSSSHGRISINRVCGEDNS